MRSRLVERLLAPLMFGVFGLACTQFSLTWLMRGNFVFTSDGQEKLITRESGVAFWAPTVTVLVLGALLLAFGAYLTLRAFRQSPSAAARPIFFSRFGMVMFALGLIVALIAIVAGFFHQ